MSDKNLSSWWNEVREDVATYLRARAQLTKLEAYEKIAKVVGVIVSFFILALLVGFVIVSILIMIGSWIGELTGSSSIGYSSVAFLVVGLFIFLSVKRKSVLEKPISNWVVEALVDEEEFIGEETKQDKTNDEE